MKEFNIEKALLFCQSERESFPATKICAFAEIRTQKKENIQNTSTIRTFLSFSTYIIAFRTLLNTQRPITRGCK